MAKQVGQLTTILIAEQNSLADLRKKISSYESMFEQLKKMTGVESLAEMVSFVLLFYFVYRLLSSYIIVDKSISLLWMCLYLFHFFVKSSSLKVSFRGDLIICSYRIIVFNFDQMK